MSSSSPFPPVPEILRLICEHLASDKRALARLARTCKMLEEPALDTLWFDISGFYPFVKCLPDDALKVDRRSYSYSERLTLTRLLKPVELARYLSYSRKVHHLSNKGDPNRIDEAIFHILQLSDQSGKLLPNLRRLTWHFERDSTIGLLYMFLGPRLTDISFKLTYNPQVPELSIVTALDNLYPSLKYLSFDITDPPEYMDSDRANSAKREAVEILSNSIQIYKWKDLQTFKIMNLTCSALNKVSQLPQLRRFEIAECDFHSESQTASLALAGGGFSVLTDLVLGNCSNISDCIVVLKAMDCSPINTMELGFREEVSPALWEEIILTISQHCNHRTLRALICIERLDRPISGFNHGASRDITFEAVRPLLAFRDLESINIEAARVISIPDAAALQEIATSWTKIRCLNFKFQRGCNNDLEELPVKLLDLALFAEHCPKLEELSICFDASSPPHIDQDNVFSGKKCNSRLLKLNVGVSPITNAALVAANLSGIFPSLKSVSATPTRSYGTYDRTWTEVSGLVSVFSAVRKQTMGWPSI